MAYAEGDRVYYERVLYVCAQAHTSAAAELPTAYPYRWLRWRRDPHFPIDNPAPGVASYAWP